MTRRSKINKTQARYPSLSHRESIKERNPSSHQNTSCVVRPSFAHRTVRAYPYRVVARAKTDHTRPDICFPHPPTIGGFPFLFRNPKEQEGAVTRTPEPFYVTTRRKPKDTGYRMRKVISEQVKEEQTQSAKPVPSPVHRYKARSSLLRWCCSPRSSGTRPRT